MLKTKVLYLLIALFSVLFAVLQMAGVYNISQIFGALVVPLITILYIVNIGNKSTYLLLSLVSYSLSDIFNIFNNEALDSLNYYVGNALYMVAYVALIFEISYQFKVKNLIRYFKMYLLVLFLLNVYANYFLLFVIKDFIIDYDYSVELIYNIFTILLLSVAILNYFYRFDKKSSFLFLGSLMIAFSEALQIGYYYLLTSIHLKIAFSILIFAAYFLFYLQAKLKYERVLFLEQSSINPSGLPKN